MSKSVRLDPEAEEEIAAAMEWYESERAGLASEFLMEVQSAMSSLRKPGPECRPATGFRPELGVRRKLLKRFPYLLLFMEFESTVRVLAVAHARQRPGYWRRRI